MSNKNKLTSKYGLYLTTLNNEKNYDFFDKRVFYFKNGKYKLEEAFPMDEENIYFVGVTAKADQIFSFIKINFPQFILQDRKKINTSKLNQDKTFAYTEKNGGKIYPPETFSTSNQLKKFNPEIHYHDINSIKIVILKEKELAVVRDPKEKIRILIGKGVFILKSPAAPIGEKFIFQEKSMKKITCFDGGIIIGTKIKIYDSNGKLESVFIDINNEGQVVVRRFNDIFLFNSGKYLLGPDDWTFYFPKRAQLSSTSSKIISQTKPNAKIILNFSIKWKVFNALLFQKKYLHSDIQQVLLEELKGQLYDWAMLNLDMENFQESKVIELFAKSFSSLRKRFQINNEKIGLKIKKFTFESIQFYY